MNNWIAPESRALNRAEMENNAAIIWNFFGSQGWTANAVSAMLGNMEAESAINPARWQNDNIGNLSGGFGLVQWTPATKVRNWIRETYNSEDYTNGVYQMERIIYEKNNRIQWYSTAAFPLSFTEFAASEKAPGYLAVAFLKNYECPEDQSASVQNYRASLANKWYEVITGLPAPHWSRFPVWLLFRFNRTVIK